MNTAIKLSKAIKQLSPAERAAYNALKISEQVRVAEQVMKYGAIEYIPNYGPIVPIGQMHPAAKLEYAKTHMIPGEWEKFDKGTPEKRNHAVNEILYGRQIYYPKSPPYPPPAHMKPVPRSPGATTAKRGRSSSSPSSRDKEIFFNALSSSSDTMKNIGNKFKKHVPRSPPYPPPAPAHAPFAFDTPATAPGFAATAFKTPATAPGFSPVHSPAKPRSSSSSTRSNGSNKSNHSNSKKKRQKPCEKGTRRNPKTKQCEPTGAKGVKKPAANMIGLEDIIVAAAKPGVLPIAAKPTRAKRVVKAKLASPPAPTPPMMDIIMEPPLAKKTRAKRTVKAKIHSPPAAMAADDPIEIPIPPAAPAAKPTRAKRVAKAKLAPPAMEPEVVIVDPIVAAPKPARAKRVAKAKIAIGDIINHAAADVAVAAPPAAKPARAKRVAKAKVV